MNQRFIRDPRTGLLRAPFRLAAFFAAWLVAAVLVYSVLGLAAGILGKWFGVRVVIYTWATLLSIVAAHYFCLRVIDRISWSDVGLGSGQTSLPPVVTSFALGAAAISLPSLLLLALGWLRIEPAEDGSFARVAVVQLLSLAPAAAWEEFLFRGYIFTVLRQSWNWKVALIATSISFGLLHAGNPNVSSQSIIAVMVAGLFVGTVFLWTRSMVAAIAVHLGWNWALVSLLHARVSGIGMEAPEYRMVDSGPDLFTGGAWGPEGGAASALGMLLALWYLSRVRRATSDWPSMPTQDPSVRGLFPRGNTNPQR